MVTGQAAARLPVPGLALEGSRGPGKCGAQHLSPLKAARSLAVSFPLPLVFSSSHFVKSILTREKSGRVAIGLFYFGR